MGRITLRRASSPRLAARASLRPSSDATLDASFAIIDKRRPRANVSEVMNVVGEVGQ